MCIRDRLSTEPRAPPVKYNLEDFHVKARVLETWDIQHKKESNVRSALLPMMLEYRDVLWTGRTAQDAPDIQKAVSLHVLNHILKSRDLTLKNDGRAKAAEEANEGTEFRDQGFTKPKVLILLPFKGRALKYMQSLLAAAPQTLQEVENKARFMAEFGEGEDDAGIHPAKPEDYKATFEGNIDDAFRVGVKFTKRSIKLYSEFYSSDLILASPLGLRMLIGAPGDKKRDFDFLSSIEIFVMDEADIMLMQNWEHVRTVFENTSAMPQTVRDSTDFFRVRSCFLSGWAKYLRQTVIVSSQQSAEVTGLFKRQCHNVIKYQIDREPAEQGVLADCIGAPKQVFQRVQSTAMAASHEERMQHFTEKVLPTLLRAETPRTVILCRSYFEFVALRNLFRRKEASFCTLSEYTSQKGISRNSQWWSTQKRKILLITERFHFFRRQPIRNINQLIVYSLPEYAHFYSEFVNNLSRNAEDAPTSMVMYNKYDWFQLDRAVGRERAQQMLISESTTHLFC
eukprot:TRINITY_DN33745_c0_g1_i1.p1 TRINITY_DN33745_c0_g1~~TRINITY_DN33745_c0_g1_i1.p1  ORF type:complete len:511 (-),score=114.82 TRINITY_DN33745_c0_g1_i1:10-1542(-)